MKTIVTIAVLALLMACGTDGKDGSNGADGEQGIDGTDGKTGTDGADGASGAVGANGTAGTNGIDGEDGGKIIKFIYCSAIIPYWISSTAPSFIEVAWGAKVTNSGDMFVTGSFKHESSIKATLTNATYAAGQLQPLFIRELADRHVSVNYDESTNNMSIDYELPYFMDSGVVENNNCQTLTF